MQEGQTISCKFDNTERTYTYKVPAHLTVKAGDRVIVGTPKNGPTEVIVTDVHATPIPETTFKIKEIMSVVNPEHEV